MTPGDRLKAWIEGLSASWKDKLKGWLSSAIGFGFEVILDVIAKKGSEQLKPLIAKLESTGAVPPELQPMIDEIKNPTGELAGLNIASLVSRASGGAVNKLLDAFLMQLAYGANYLITEPHLQGVAGLKPSEQDMIQLYIKNYWSHVDLQEQMRIHGYPAETINQLLPLWRIVLPTDVVLPVWMRDKTKWQKMVDEFTHLGLTTDQILLLKEAALKYPTANEAISWLAHEVFEPDMVEKYGLDDEWGGIDKSLLDKIGIHPDMQINYWRNHWQHATWPQVTQMLHRGLVTEQDVYDWYRLVEIPPYWRDNLTALSWDLPNRIELRMMARYGLITKPELVDALAKIGVHPDYRDLIADMSLAMGVRTDVASRYSKGWINKDGVKAAIADSGISPAIGDRMYQWIVSNVSNERTAPERDLTAAEIIKGVKKEVITWDDGVERLMAMGYDQEEALFKLAINIEVLTGSPESKAEFKRLTDLYRLARGMPTDRPAEQIIEAEKSLAGQLRPPAHLADEELRTRVDTIRRRRRRDELTRDQEIADLLALGLTTTLAEAYADNDDLRTRAGG